MAPFLTRKKNFQDAKLVVSIDIGTTFTAASICLPPDDKDDPFRFQEINRWPKQFLPDAKVPSTIFYDRNGAARLHGAETTDSTSLYNAETSGWEKAEWWKLHLRPTYLPLPEGFKTKALPPHVTVDKAFEDQFGYVFKNIQEFITLTHGYSINWAQLSASMVVILTAPNAWEGCQRERMRNAAIKAGLVNPDTKNRLRFVSEGEAAVHYCLDQISVRNIEVGGTVLVCDAGGGTTDLSVYRIMALDPIYMEEILSPRCIMTGGVYVDYAAKEFFERRLKGTRWDSQDIIGAALRTFEKEIKRGFTGKDDNDITYISLGESGASDLERGITRGRLKITRDEMAAFFEPAIQRLTDGLDSVLSDTPSQYTFNQVFVVGGFAESSYVFSRVAKFVQRRYGVPTAKPDGVLSKAIAHGGLSWHFNSIVRYRLTRFHYGAETNVAFRETEKDMVGRQKYKNIKGEWRVRSAWRSIVSKGTRLRSDREHREFFHLDVSNTDDLEIELEIYAYRLQDPPAFFKDKDGNLVDGFVHIGTVKGNLTNCYNAMKFRTPSESSSKKYKTLEYEIGLSFGDVELSARLYWKENGVSMPGEATIAYDL